MDNDKSGAWKMLAIIADIAGGVSIAIAGLLINEIHELRKDNSAMVSRISAIESSRFRAEDGLEVWKAIGNIQISLAKLPTELPPKWFIDRVATLEQKLDRNGETLARLSERFEAHNAITHGVKGQ